MANNGETLEVDINGIYGYGKNKPKPSRITHDMPPWKIEVLRKKEAKEMAKYKLKMAVEFEESQIPDWKKPLVKIHARRKSEQSEKEEVERKRAEEAEKRFKALPAWKQKLILQKRSKCSDSDEGASAGCNGDTCNELIKAKAENMAEFDLNGKDECGDINDEVEDGVDDTAEVNEGDCHQTEENNENADEMNGDVGVDKGKDEKIYEENDEEQNQEENEDNDEEAGVEEDDEINEYVMKNEEEDKDAENEDVEKDDVEKDDVEKDDVEKDDVEKDDVEKDDVEKDDVEKDDVEKDDVEKDDVEKENKINEENSVTKTEVER